MRPAALTLIVGLLACLMNPVGLPSAEPTVQQPTLAQPRAAGQPLDERLDRLELQLQLIQQHLGLRFRLPPATSGADMTLPDQSTDDDRIARLEREARRFDERFEQVQRQLDGVRAPTRATPEIKGRLVVQNLTGVPHYLSVNKVQQYIQPGRTDIWVPYQMVEAYLPSHELPRLLGMSLWRWTGRDYDMLLEIKN